jgi:hypothetical protein
LGKSDKANGLFYKLITYGEKHVYDDVKMDYFAVSLPDLLIWDNDLNVRNVVHCKYMMALGYWGIGNVAKSRKYLSEAAASDVNHQGIVAFKSMMPNR